ncbi:putative N-acetyltransferase YjaB [compost metagenome]
MIIKSATTADYDRLMHVWASAVKATHHFLAEEDFLYFKSIIAEQFFPQVQLYGIWDKDGVLQAFLGTADDMLEMLFVEADVHGQGYGKALLEFAIHTLGIRKVDVNEQNEGATAFYLSQGFAIQSRSEKDGMGKDYPILHLSLA